MSEFDRYSRQIRFEPIGAEGQRQLSRSRVVLAGCGALGSVSGSLLVRAGVGALRIIDRDFVELDNLQRQMLFDEDDVRSGLPKAEAARKKLARVNSSVQLDACVADITPQNAAELLGGCDLILDATDNFETRGLINDFAVKTDTPWIYAAVVASEGRTMTVIPGRTLCLRCVFDEPPQAGALPTCETAGVIGPAVTAVASFQVAEALKLLMGRTQELRTGLLALDVWSGTFRTLFAGPAGPRADCPACSARRFEFLEGGLSSTGVKLCGRDAVHVSPPAPGHVDLQRLAARLCHQKVLLTSEFLLRFEADGKELTVFSDGRAIIKGTTDPTIARAVYAKYVGS
jgi:molybdopterin-synthase adenylyltransferase